MQLNETISHVLEQFITKQTNLPPSLPLPYHFSSFRSFPSPGPLLALLPTILVHVPTILAHVPIPTPPIFCPSLPLPLSSPPPFAPPHPPNTLLSFFPILSSLSYPLTCLIPICSPFSRLRPFPYLVPSLSPLTLLSLSLFCPFCAASTYLLRHVVLPSFSPSSICSILPSPSPGPFMSLLPLPTLPLFYPFMSLLPLPTLPLFYPTHFCVSYSFALCSHACAILLPRPTPSSFPRLSLYTSDLLHPFFVPLSYFLALSRSSSTSPLPPDLIPCFFLCSSLSPTLPLFSTSPPLSPLTPLLSPSHPLSPPLTPPSPPFAPFSCLLL